MKPTFSLVALLALVPYAAAFWRLECFGVAAVARLDPIVNPGETSGHAHLIHGSSGLSDNSTADDLLKASCSSCQVKQDHSAYWEPQLYFMNSNGSAMLVNETPGHLTYYKYTPIYSSEGVLMQPEVLPNGLKVISGDTFRRNFTLPVPDPPLPWTGADATQEALAQKAIGFNCLNYAKKPEGSLYRHFLPDKQYLETECPDGIRMEVLFPQCWNGELDSPDHKSHMAYGDAGLNGGKCPPGYNRTTMQIFYETIYPTQNFKGVDGFYAFSNGDPTGYGFHGDLLIAWEEGILQKALDACGSDTTGDDISGVITDCPIFDVISPADQDKCLIPDSQQPANLLKTPVMPSLPGNNPIQSGPQAATMAHGDAPKTQSYKAPASSLVPTLAYSQGTANILKVDPTPSAKALAALPAAQHVSSSTSSAPQSTITAAPPAPPAAVNNVVPQLSTITYTSNGVVYEEALVVDEVTVTDLDVVTVTEPAGARKRRDDHRRRHNHARFHQH